MKLRLRELTYVDIPDSALLANNRKIWNNLRDIMPHPNDEKDAKAFIDLCKEQSSSRTFGIFFEEKLSGVIGVQDQHDIYRHSIELGYWIGEPFWGKGIATEAVSQMVNYVFDSLQKVRILSNVYEHNKASMRVLEKNGFRLEGIRKKAVLKNDILLDEYLYYKLCNE